MRKTHKQNKELIGLFLLPICLTKNQTDASCTTSLFM